MRQELRDIGNIIKQKAEILDLNLYHGREFKVSRMYLKCLVVACH